MGAMGSHGVSIGIYWINANFCKLIPNRTRSSRGTVSGGGMGWYGVVMGGYGWIRDVHRCSEMSGGSLWLPIYYKPKESEWICVVARPCT